MIGSIVGNYRITGQLGEGGMGVVYAAEHQLIGRKAAIKVLHPEMSAQASIVQRFFNEARATSLIRHPGIVDVFDFGHLGDGRAFIAMEFLDGESLASRLRTGRSLLLAEIVAIGQQAAAALGAAHDKGIVHRDLKPDNIYLVPDEQVAGGVRVKILDFGIAKLAPDGPGRADIKTRTGVIMGTPAYMSPEQCKSAGEVDFRSDIYSMGCVLYEMACGRPPFLGEGVGEVIGAHIYEAPPPPRSLNSRVSPALEAAVLRTLAKNPSQRTPSMAQLRRELEDAAGPHLRHPPGERDSPPARLGTPPSQSTESRTTLGDSASESIPPRRRSRSRPVAIVAAAAGLTIAVAAVAAWIAASRSVPGNAAAGPSQSPSVEHRNPVVPVEQRPVLPQPVHLHIESDPSGADVLDPDNGRVLGRTPFDQTLPRADAEAAFTVRLAGYDDGHLILSTRTDGAGSVQMRPAPVAGPQHGSSHGSSGKLGAPPGSSKSEKKKDVGLFD